MYSKLAIGDKAPDFRFKTPWDGETNFYDVAGNNPAVLIFLRYYGCPVCQMEMVKIKQEIDLVRQKGGRGIYRSAKCAGNTCFSDQKRRFPLHDHLRPSRESFPTLWCRSRRNYQISASHRFACGNQGHQLRL